MRPRCGWLWMHDTPPYLISDRGEHYCARPPGHKPPHQCYCGEKDAP